LQSAVENLAGHYDESARVHPCETIHLAELERRIKSLGFLDAEFDTNRDAGDFIIVPS
jgi:hypothetical protein